jgi:glycosyltransferase involved in cell wall biosynthesis
MKILLIAPLPPPVTGHSLASQVFYEELVKSFKVEVVNFSKDSFVSGINSFYRIFQIFRLFKDIWCKKKNVDIIYFTISESIAGNIKDIIIYLLCIKSLSKMVIHLHGGSIKKLIFDKIKFLYLINKYFISRLGGVIVLGESHLNIFSGLIEKQRIYIVPNFAEDYLFANVKMIEEKFEKIELLRVLFLSNLIKGKGHNVLVNAYKALSYEFKKKIRLDFAGAFESAKHRNKFLKNIEGDVGIKYHGIVKGTVKKNLFSNAHIFCLPSSLNEGQPISILESYASGCVVITTNQGGIVDIFKDKINGFSVEKESSESLRLVIEDILKNKQILLPIAISNRIIANYKYRTSNYISLLLSILGKITNH